MSQWALEIKDLQVEFSTYGGVVKAVRGVNLAVEQGKTLAIVGESGCGKSVTVQSIMGLIPIPPGRITSGTALLEGKNLIGMPLRELNNIRGKDIGMIFQDPMSSLNPTMKIGSQIAETLLVHRKMNRREALKEAERLLDLCRVSEPGKRVHQYPFEFSGGMLQRAMIALALACKPKVLIADEPTTALDVTIQDQILDLMRDLQASEKMAIVLITHDLGVVARMADHVAVMYAGQIVEYGEAEAIFYQSSHPYTVGLKTAMPTNQEGKHTGLEPIPGSPPDLFHPPVGCGYYARCPYAMKVCKDYLPSLMTVKGAHSSRCWLQDQRAGKQSHVYQEWAT